MTTPERFVVESLPEAWDALGWTGCRWRWRCPDCDQTGPSERHPADASMGAHAHNDCPALQVDSPGGNTRNTRNARRYQQ